MKTITKLLLIAIVCFSCNKEVQYDKEAVILIDRTDPLTVYPNANEILSSLGINNDRWQGIKITVSEITDKDVNRKVVVAIEKENKYLGNPKIRAAKIERFKSYLAKALIISDSVSSFAHSIIYCPLAKHLNDLSSSKVDDKYLFIYSNMMENSDLNFYDKFTFSLQKDNPKLIEQKLEKNLAIHDLSNINIWIIYKPNSFEENATFMSASHFFEHLFISKNALVRIESNLN